MKNKTQETNAVALVTGGSRGIGRAICLELAGQGYFVVINYKTKKESAEETLKMIQDRGAQGSISCFDVTDSEKTEQALEQLFEEHESIEVLVNNAGIAADQLFIMMPEADWDQVIQTTLKGFYNLTKPVLNRMLVQKKGSVVSIASLSAFIGNRGQANYAAAKSGLIGASRTVASEVARFGIRVNVVAPGLIETEMTEELPFKEVKARIPMARIGQPEEVAKVVKFLCSEEASYITGQVVSVNGGML